MEYTVDFERLEWLEWAEVGTARAKTAFFPGVRLRLVELSHRFAKTDWCDSGHAGYVIEGEVEVELEGKSPFRCRQGGGLVIPQGTRHRSRNVGDGPARLFLVERLDGRPKNQEVLAVQADRGAGAESYDPLDS